VRMGWVFDLLSIEAGKRVSWPSRSIVPLSRVELTGVDHRAASGLAVR
jgi:hypothetical protein